MKKRFKNDRIIRLIFLCAVSILIAAVCFVLWENVPQATVRHTLIGLVSGINLVVILWAAYLRKSVSDFADELCEMLDALISGREPENYQAYEDIFTTKVQSKLFQYYDIMHEGRLQSRQDRQMLQELISDISHQVKTPVANMKMFTGILKQHEISKEKHTEFLNMMEGQINKLDFLMQSLIKMSRLETGTYKMHVVEAGLYNTIAQAVNGIWAKAGEKGILLSVECDSGILVKHDPKWTAEALMNILDNAVKYTPAGGSVSITVLPWQIYTRIDITDTGPGIAEAHYNDVFKRFYRVQEAAAVEGVGLGLHLAQGIIVRQKGYISVKSKPGQGTSFSVYLLSG